MTHEQSSPNGVDRGQSINDKSTMLKILQDKGHGQLEIKKAAPGGKWTIIRLSYDISGATITNSKDDNSQNANKRTLDGLTNSDRLRISGTAHVEGATGYPSQLGIQVREGASSLGAKVKEYGDKIESGDGDMKFDIIVPISRDKTYNFHIQQDCMLNYVNSVIVDCILNPSTETNVQPNPDQEQKPPTPAPIDEPTIKQNPPVEQEPSSDSSGPEVVGDSDSVAKIKNALELLKTKAPEHYAIVAKYIGKINVSESGSGMYWWESPPRFQIGKVSVDQYGPESPVSPIMLAGTILHDAVHSKLAHDYLSDHPGADVPKDIYYGKNAEGLCLAAQYDVVKKLGGNELVLKDIKDAINSGYWEIDYAKRWW